MWQQVPSFTAAGAHATGSSAAAAHAEGFPAAALQAFRTTPLGP
jgi:hypothetical protein